MSWSDDKELSLGVDIIGWNPLKKIKIYISYEEEWGHRLLPRKPKNTKKKKKVQASCKKENY